MFILTQLIIVSGKLSIKNSNVSSRNGNNVNINSGLSSRYNSNKSHSTYMTRSSSVGVLNQVLRYFLPFFY